jgi:hypothetical protein
MVFRLLNFFGLDVSAKIDAVIGALSASAAITGAMALRVGLIALYRRTAEVGGAYVGLEVDGAFLDQS